MVAAATMKRVPEFDGVRAVAIGLVIICHVCARSPQLLVTRLIGRQGWYGVDIFFILSGFLITRLLITEQQTSGRIDLPKFYVRRIFRLYPALISAVGITLLGLLVMGLRRDVRVLFAFLPLILTYTFNFWVSFFGAPPGFQLGQIWSLCVEEHFYLMWPAVLRRLNLDRALWVLIVALTIAIITRIGVWVFLPTSFSTDFIAYSTFTRIDGIILGCIMGIIVPRVEAFPFLYASRALWLYMLLSIVSIEWGGSSPRFYAIGGSLIMGLPVAFAITAMWLGGRCGVSRVLTAAPLVEVGKVSYGIYLFHLAVLAAVLRLLRIQEAKSSMIALGLFILVCLITFAVSEMHYRTIEIRFLALREHLFHRRRSRRDIHSSMTASVTYPS